MGQYGESAVAAAFFISRDKISPMKAWSLACEQKIKSVESRKKGCPRKAFLGICGAGFLNVELRSDFNVENEINSKNGMYAIKALALIKERPELAKNKKYLWIQVLKHFNESIAKKHNGQIDVVVSLWDNGLIVEENSVE